MIKDRNFVMQVVKLQEAGFVIDVGGPTNFGITLPVLADYRGHPQAADDIRNLTWAEASDIYVKNYWNKIHGDDLPPGLDLCVMDCAVNQGQGTAIKMLQAALKLPTDGNMGPVTLGVIKKGNVHTMCVEFMTLRAMRYANTKDEEEYGHSWYQRMFEVYTYAVALFQGTATTATNTNQGGV